MAQLPAPASAPTYRSSTPPNTRRAGALYTDGDDVALLTLLPATKDETRTSDEPSFVGRRSSVVLRLWSFVVLSMSAAGHSSASNPASTHMIGKVLPDHRARNVLSAGPQMAPTP